MEQVGRDEVNRKRQFSVDRAAVPDHKQKIQAAGAYCVVVFDFVYLSLRTTAH